VGACTIHAGWLPGLETRFLGGSEEPAEGDVTLRGKGQDGAMGRRRTGPASRRSTGPARAFVLTLAVGLLVGLLLGFFLGRIGGGGREQAAPLRHQPVP
jgi:hypothetical protein